MESGISVIIPVVDRPEFLREAVTSVMATGYLGLEIVIVDDGSSSAARDRSLELIRPFEGAVRWLASDAATPRGPGYSRNRGLHAATNPWVAFLDSDDVYFPNRFEVSAPRLRAEPSVSAVYEPAVREVLIGGEERSRTVRERIDFLAPEGEVLSTILTRGRHWAISAVLARRDFVLGLGGFGEDTRSAEDLTLWLKMACAGRLVPGGHKPVAAYRMHAGNYSAIPRGEVADAAWYSLREVLDWAKRRGFDREVVSGLRAAFVGKTLYIVNELLLRQRRRRASSMLAAAALVVPGLVASRTFWGNLVAASLPKSSARAGGATRHS